MAVFNTTYIFTYFYEILSSWDVILHSQQMLYNRVLCDLVFRSDMLIWGFTIKISYAFLISYPLASEYLGLTIMLGEQYNFWGFSMM